MLRFSRNYTHSVNLARLPVDLVLVRNGICEGSVALRKAFGGNDPQFIEKLKQSHSSKWRLTDFGKLQAKSTGQWLRENFGTFNAFLTGEYIRSLETAACLGLPGAIWFPSLYLRPRDFGSFSVADANFDEKEYEEHYKNRERDSFYWTPPNGESIAHVTMRAERVIHWIRRHVPSDGSCIIVTHKDVMEAMRIRLERISQLDYTRKILNCPPKFALNYASVLHFTRRNPKTQEVVPRYRWMRVVTPWMGKSYNSSDYSEIVINHYGNAELLVEVSNSPKLFSK